MIAETVKEAKFSCQLSQCKGKCCVEGDRGGPLTEQEARELEDLQEVVLDRLTPASRRIVTTEGPVFREGEKQYTPLLYEEGPCVYLSQGDDGILGCVLEQLFEEGRISLRKPKSCHLFPLLHKKTDFYEVLTVEKRNLCSSSWGKGPHLIEFEKEALLRSFGEGFVRALFKELDLEWQD